MLTDAAGNAYAGISNATDLNFTTAAAGDTTVPTVSTYSPADNATGVGTADNIVLTFSEPVFAQAGQYLVIKLASNNTNVEKRYP